MSIAFGHQGILLFAVFVIICNEYQQSRGGTHVNYITNQIIKAFEQELAKKKILSITSGNIRNRLGIFIRCDIENPTFDSQSKDTLTKKQQEFGSECILPKAFLKKIIKESGLIDDLEETSRIKEQNLASKLIKSKTTNSGMKQLIDIPKLEDAHEAGKGDKGLNCTLILTEGDSAKALAVAGIEVVGRQYYGVLPLRGKILNVRDSKIEVVSKNEELINLVRAIGLSFDKSYAKGIQGQGLRYGHVMIMCDQDNDGSHIKGLLINFFHHFWPNLLNIKGMNLGIRSLKSYSRFDTCRILATVYYSSRESESERFQKYVKERESISC